MYKRENIVIQHHKSYKCPKETITRETDNMNSSMIGRIAIFCIIAAVATGYEHNKDHGPAHYKFEYSVHDPHTGDIKQQHETGDGHVVKGAYSFAEADGTKRVVEYIADPHGGFNAVVKRIGHARHPQHYGHHGGHGEAGDHYGGAHSDVGTTHCGFHY